MISTVAITLVPLLGLGLTDALLLSGVLPSTPSQVHHAFNSPDSISVSWTQREKEDDPCLAPYVTYQSDSVVLISNATAESYNPSNDTIYNSVLSSLIPGTKYDFRVGCDGVSSEESFSFTTLPDKYDDSAFSFLAFGDMGVTNAAKGEW